ncbi:hypothetical protein [Tamlana sp. I1]|uniref:hypothetical protein n=1 Tax=Tamlana sp. I1 TaxID=2762061 RepID=UPI00188E855A|nr:hypothetical protein [Tamlana sp. I1]
MNKKKLSKGLIILMCGVFLLSSCEKDDVSSDELTEGFSENSANDDVSSEEVTEDSTNDDVNSDEPTDDLCKCPFVKISSKDH